MWICREERHETRLRRVDPSNGRESGADLQWIGPFREIIELPVIYATRKQLSRGRDEARSQREAHTDLKLERCGTEPRGVQGGM